MSQMMTAHELKELTPLFARPRLAMVRTGQAIQCTLAEEKRVSGDRRACEGKDFAYDNSVGLGKP